MRRVKRGMIRAAANFLPFEPTIKLARFLLASQGVGFAVDVKDSGELTALSRLVSSANPTYL